MGQEFDVNFIEGIKAVEPYLDRIVLAGGWAPCIYSRMYGFGLHRNPLITRDIDFVLPRRGFVDGTPPLDQTIITAGFRHEFASLENPPVVKYVKELAEAGVVEIEFITDAPGQGENVVRIGSVNAQELRYVGLLFDDTWEVDLCSLGLDLATTVLVPKPSAYILHKSLIAGRRRHKEKTAKDLYYIFYTLEAFPDWHDGIIESIRQFRGNHGKLAAKALAFLHQCFTDMDSRGVDYLLSQRPNTAFTDMNDDQFRQYALAIMTDLLEALR